MRHTRIQDRPASRQVNDHGRVSGTHRVGVATASDCWERCGAVLDHDPHRPGAGPQRWLCPQCARRAWAADAVGDL